MSKNSLASADEGKEMTVSERNKIIEKNPPPLVVNIACTKYAVVKKAMKKIHKMKLITKKEDDKGAVRKGQGGL